MGFNVTAAWSQASYNQGDTIVGTISGDYTTTVLGQIGIAGPLQVPIVANGGAQGDAVFPAVPIMGQVPQSEAVTIDATRPIVDNGTPPRQWTISADGKSINAVA